jgi:small subunit ribosomal protein S9
MSETELGEAQIEDLSETITEEVASEPEIVVAEPIIEEENSDQSLSNQEDQKENQYQQDQQDREEQKFEEVEVVNIGKGRYIEGIGRRKTSIARVRIWDNPDKEVMAITVNGRKYTEYLPSLDLQKSADAPLRKLRLIQGYKVTVKTKGGGLRGQADAIKLGLARALVKLNPDWRARLKKALLLRRDSRKVERKKYGLKKARRAPQWSKR